MATAASQAPVSKTQRSRLDEAIGIILLFLGLVLLLSLVSYHPNDPSWNAATAQGRAANLIGPIGAHLADLLLQVFGLVVFALPVVLFAFGGYKLLSRDLKAPLVKCLGWLTIFLTLAGLLSLFLPNDFYWRSVRPGGVVGLLIASQLESILNWTGAALLLIVVFVLSLMTIGNVSFVGGAGSVAELMNKLRVRLKSKEETAIEMLLDKPSPVQPKKDAKADAGKAKEPKIAGWEDFGAGAQAKASMLVEEDELLEEEEDIESLFPPPPIRPSETTPTVPRRQPRPPVVMAEADIEVGPVEKPSVPPLPIDIEDVIERNTTPATVGGSIGPRRIETRRAVGAAEDEVAEMLSTAEVKTVKAVEKATKIERKPIARTMEKFVLPGVDMLAEPAAPHEQVKEELMQRAVTLAEKCKEFAVTGHVHQISPGPVVTTFEFKPDPGIKYNRITSLVDDLCLALEAESIRIDRIPGKSTVGIEVPNKHRELIYLREIIESKKYQDSRSRLTIALGKTIDGGVYITDLAKMPHLLIAGATGAGKSMTVNCIIASILFKATPEEVKFILIDPKRLELGLYEDIPYLLAPIVTDPKRASYALKWAVAEMENRYKLLAGFGVRNIEQFNREVRDMTDRHLTLERGEPVRPLPYLVIVIDELADLMMVASSDVETAITRLAQMARAVGIHLILTTQRPSVDVITGLIKANFPSRIAFRVSQKVDSRTIIDGNGAEALLGKGDMLFLPPGSSRLIRVHGAFIEEKEIKHIVEFLKAQANPEYDETVLMSDKEYEAAQSGGAEKYDELYEDALKIVIHIGRASTSVLQRRLRIGYGRAASIIDMMEREGYVEPADGPRPRAITRKAVEFRERLQQMDEEEE